MRIINRIDVLIFGILTIFLLNIIAVKMLESEGIFVTVCGAIVTLVGYAFIRPVVIKECELNGGK